MKDLVSLRPFIVAFAGLILLFLVGCSAFSESETQPKGYDVLSPTAIRTALDQPVVFASHVRPVLERKCVVCHNSKIKDGHMRLDSRSEALRSGALGQYIVRGHPEQSLLITNITSSHRNLSVMPLVGERLTDNERAILVKWVKEGAAWPKGAAGRLQIDQCRD